MLDPLLTLCARLSWDDGIRTQFEQAVTNCCDWDGLLGAAEAHGLSPLLYHHLCHTGLPELPESARITLKLQYLRHRRRGQIWTAVLRDVLLAYQESGIDLLLLKGGALRHVLYPDPALRPMGDLDLLVKPQDAPRAQQVLIRLGFQPTRFPGRKQDRYHHLPAAYKEQDGLRVSVEVHHNVFHPTLSISMRWDDVRRPFCAVPIGDLTAFSLGYEDMLWHLCHHTLTFGEPLRLITVTDILGFAERFVDVIDWDLVRRRYPFVMNTLALLGLLASPPARLQQRLDLSVTKIPSGIGESYQGWPARQTKLIEIWSRPGTLRDLVQRSFGVSDWWLRLYYGLDDRQSVMFCRCVTHPIHLGKRILQWLFFKI